MLLVKVMICAFGFTVSQCENGAARFTETKRMPGNEIACITAAEIAYAAVNLRQLAIGPREHMIVQCTREKAAAE
jgi:hypothetical protein